MPRSPLMNTAMSVLFYVFLWFGFWTIGTNLFAMAEAPCDVLIYHFILTNIVVIAAVIKFGSPYQHDDFDTDLLKTSCTSMSWTTKGLAGVLLSISLVTALATYTLHHGWLLFIGFMSIASSVIFLQSRTGDETTAQQAPASHQGLLLLLFTTLVISLYLFGHQIDTDDANFINLGIGVFRSQGGIFELDTMIGDGPLPLHLPTYKAHSFELLFATLAYILPGTTLFYAHIAIPVLLCGVLAFSLFYINTSLFGRHWFSASLIQLAILIFCLDTISSLGAHGLFRLFQGKAGFLLIIMPLIVAQTIRWNTYGKYRDLVFTFLLMVSGCGFTANAIFAAPMALGLAALPFLFMKPLSASNIKQWLLTFSPVIYPALIAGLILSLEGAHPSEILTPATLTEAIFTHLGWSLIGVLFLAMLPVAAFFTKNHIAAKYSAIYVAAAVFFLLNPLLWPIYAAITGNLPARLFWSLPIPLLLSFTIIYVSNVTLSMINTHTLRYSGLIALSTLFLLLSLFSTNFKPNPPVPINWKPLPTYRVNTAEFQLAKAFVKISAEDDVALLPAEIADDITMIEGHPYPIAVRNLYLQHYRHTMATDELTLRSELFNSVTDASHQHISADRIRQGIHQLNIQWVLISEQNQNFANYRAALNELNFSETQPFGKYRLFGKH